MRTAIIKYPDESKIDTILFDDYDFEGDTLILREYAQNRGEGQETVILINLSQARRVDMRGGSSVPPSNIPSTTWGQPANSYIQVIEETKNILNTLYNFKHDVGQAAALNIFELNNFDREDFVIKVDNVIQKLSVLFSRYIEDVVPF